MQGGALAWSMQASCTTNSNRGNEMHDICRRSWQRAAMQWWLSVQHESIIVPLGEAGSVTTNESHKWIHNMITYNLLAYEEPRQARDQLFTTPMHKDKVNNLAARSCTPSPHFFIPHSLNSQPWCWAAYLVFTASDQMQGSSTTHPASTVHFKQLAAGIATMLVTVQDISEVAVLVLVIFYGLNHAIQSCSQSTLGKKQSGVSEAD